VFHHDDVGIDPQDLGAQIGFKPFITAMTMIRAATPKKIPAIEMKVIMETKTCFRLALR